MIHSNHGPRSSRHQGRWGYGGWGAILTIVQGSEDAEDALSFWVIPQKSHMTSGSFADQLEAS